MQYRRDRKGWMQGRWDEGLDRCMKLVMQERRDEEQERFWAGGIRKVGCRTGGMQNKRDAEQERCCTGEIGKVGCRTGGMKDRRDA